MTETKKGMGKAHQSDIYMALKRAFKKIETRVYAD